MFNRYDQSLLDKLVDPRSGAGASERTFAACLIALDAELSMLKAELRAARSEVAELRGVVMVSQDGPPCGYCAGPHSRSVCERERSV